MRGLPIGFKTGPFRTECERIAGPVDGCRLFPFLHEVALASFTIRVWAGSFCEICAAIGSGMVHWVGAIAHFSILDQKPSEYCG